MKIKKSQLVQLIRESVQTQGGNEITQKQILENIEMNLFERYDNKGAIAEMESFISTIRDNAQSIVSLLDDSNLGRADKSKGIEQFVSNLYETHGKLKESLYNHQTHGNLASKEYRTSKWHSHNKHLR